MYIKEITVQNYKGFSSAQTVGWRPGFNILVGKNNAGKSSLIDAAELAFAHIPHLSMTTRPDPAIPMSNPSIVDVVFSVSRRELLMYLRRLGSVQISVPCPPIGSEIMRGLGINTPSVPGLQKAVDWIFDHGEFNFRLRRVARPSQNPVWVTHRTPSFDLFEFQSNVGLAATCTLGPDGTFQVSGSTQSSIPFTDFGSQLGEQFRGWLILSRPLRKGESFFNS